MMTATFGMMTAASFALAGTPEIEESTSRVGAAVARGPPGQTPGVERSMRLTTVPPAKLIRAPFSSSAVKNRAIPDEAGNAAS